MTKVNLKNNIWIEGFDTTDECFTPVAQFYPYKLDNVLYEGKTSEIPEELAKECVDCRIYNGDVVYGNYSGIGCCFKPNEAIKTACDKEDCVIYRLD